jgi:hypothetical protein
MGAGFKYFIKEDLYIGIEVLHRKTFTDYIDDVSTKYIDPIYFSQYLAPADVPVAYQLHNREPFRNITRTYIGKQRGDPKEMDSYFSTISDGLSSKEIIRQTKACDRCDVRLLLIRHESEPNMKTNSTLSYIKNSSYLFGLALLLGSTQSCSVTENTNAESKNAKTSKKEREVKIYPDLLKNVMHVKSVETAKVDFFVFDSGYDHGTL